MASKNSWLIIVLLLLMTCSSPAKLSRIRNYDSRSSIISVTTGDVLTGHVIHKQRTYDIMACAQLCLARLKCTSFNYENTRNGICELNGKSLDGDMVVGKKVLSSKKGHSFSQLIDWSVSIACYSRKHIRSECGTTLKQNNKINQNVLSVLWKLQHLVIPIYLNLRNTLRWKSLQFRIINEDGFGGYCLKIAEICINFEPCFRV